MRKQFYDLKQFIFLHAYTNAHIHTHIYIISLLLLSHKTLYVKNSAPHHKVTQVNFLLLLE